MGNNVGVYVKLFVFMPVQIGKCFDFDIFFEFVEDSDGHVGLDLERSLKSDL